MSRMKYPCSAEPLMLGLTSTWPPTWKAFKCWGNCMGHAPQQELYSTLPKRAISDTDLMSVGSECVS